ncbi:MAG: aminotransferase class IV, partial [Candidatus Omnitrophica bacterium]|nr:aminotransferase class IV [Candidatus Omnitrophota bacterium]
EIIRKLESVPRVIYTGCLGYMSFSGNMDLNILIRTLLRQKNKITFHVGAGIVADSVPEQEYEETLVKAKAMKECLEELSAPSPPKIFIDGRWVLATEKLLKSLTPGITKKEGVFETLLVERGEILFLEQHLRRVRQGAKRFGIEKELLSLNFLKILKEALDLNHLSDARLRLMLWQEGQHSHMAIVAQAYQPRPFEKGYQVAIYPHPVANPSGFKEIACQPFFQAAKYATRRKVDEVFLFDRKGHLIEGSRTNVFIVTPQGLLTPTLQTGCLPGIARHHVIQLAQREGIPVEQNPIELQDLLAAHEIFVTNSLIAISPVIKIEGKILKDGKPGPVTRRIWEAYHTLRHH